jgi:type II secretory pathway component PulF
MNPARESLMGLFLGVSAGIVLAIGALFVVPQFRDVFVSFGAKLPPETNLLLATYHWWGIVPLATFALWAFWRNPLTKGMAALIFGIVSAALLFFFCLWALYAPIFQLAAVEG